GDVHASDRRFTVGQACAGRARHGYHRALGGERDAPHQRRARSDEGGNRSLRPQEVANAAPRCAHRRMARYVTLATVPRYSHLIPFVWMSLPKRATSWLT